MGRNYATFSELIAQGNQEELFLSLKKSVLETLNRVFGTSSRFDHYLELIRDSKTVIELVIVLWRLMQNPDVQTTIIDNEIREIYNFMNFIYRSISKAVGTKIFPEIEKIDEDSKDRLAQEIKSLFDDLFGSAVKLQFEVGYFELRATTLLNMSSNDYRSLLNDFYRWRTSLNAKDLEGIYTRASTWPDGVLSSREKAPAVIFIETLSKLETYLQLGYIITNARPEYLSLLSKNI